MDECDDPYKMLANNIVSTYSDKELRRVFKETKAIKRHIANEVKNADLYGDFTDCVLTELTHNGRRRAVNNTLKETINFIYGELDVPRLRAELRYYCKLYGRSVELDMV